jgi:hypothetical protein
VLSIFVHPLLHEAGILAGSQTSRSIATSGEEHLAGLATRRSQVLIDRHRCLVGQLEPDRSTGFSLPNRCAIHRVPARRHVVDADGNYLAATQLAVDRQVEQSKVARASLGANLTKRRPARTAEA